MLAVKVILQSKSCLPKFLVLVKYAIIIPFHTLFEQKKNDLHNVFSHHFTLFIMSILIPSRVASVCACVRHGADEACAHYAGKDREEC